MTGLEKLWQDISGALLRENRWQLYLEGLRNTLVIAALACLIGIVIGLVVALIKYIASTKKSGPWKVAGAICTAYTTVIRGTPIIVQLLILYNLSYFTDGLYASIIGLASIPAPMWPRSSAAGSTPSTSANGRPGAPWAWASGPPCG